MTRIEPLREYCTVGLVFVDGAQVLAQHPHGGVEPLEGGEGIDEQHVPRMTQTDVCPFMSQHGSVVLGIVLTAEYDVVEPTEGRHLPIGDADDYTILLPVLLAVTDEQHQIGKRSDRITQRCHYTYYK